MTRRVRRVPLLAVASLSIACGASAPPPPAAEPGQTEVLYLGSVQRRHMRDAGYPLSLLTEALRLARPAVVLVEMPPAQFDRIVQSIDANAPPPQGAGPWMRAHPEVTHVVLPLRHALGFTVEPVSGVTGQAQATRTAFAERFPDGPPDEGFQRVDDYVATQLAMRGTDPLFLHGTEYLQLSGWRASTFATYADDALGEAGVFVSEARHEALMRAAIARHPGKRIAIVFAVEDRWYLEPRLRAIDGVRWLDARLFLAAARDGLDG